MRNEHVRNYNIDLLKLISCIAVVGLHVIPKDYNTLSNAMYYLCGFAVPIFFMTSGYFLLNRQVIDVEYSIKKIFGIAKIVLFWNLLIFLAKFLYYFLSKKDYLKIFADFPIQYFGSLIQHGTLWQFWYLGALIIVYASLPLLTRTNKRVLFALLGALFIICVLIEISSIKFGFPVQEKIIQTFRLWTWFFYFTLGGLMKTILNFINKIKAIYLQILFLVYSLFNVFYQHFIGLKILSDGLSYINAEYFYDSFFEIVWIILLFSTIMRIKIKTTFFRYIKFITPLTLGIYIVHPLIIKVYKKISSQLQVTVPYILLWCIIFLVSLAIIKMIQKSPLNKLLLKI